MKKKNIIMALGVVLLPTLVQVLLSHYDEMSYFRGLAYGYPIYISIFAFYLMLSKNRKGVGIGLIFLSMIFQYGYGFYFYVMYQKMVDAYAVQNNLPLDFDGILPLVLALGINLVIYMSTVVNIGLVILVKKILTSKS